MILYKKQDITTVLCGIIGHGVNCQRKMKSGVALSIRNKWPIVYDEYEKLPGGRSCLGTAQFVEVADNIVVANMFTQEYYGYGGVRYADPHAIEAATIAVIRYSLYLGLPVYLPKIGSDRGGLDWCADVVPVLNSAIQAVDETATINICEWS